MVPTIHINRIYRIIDEETADFRSTTVWELLGSAAPVRRYEPLREPARYTRVLNKPDTRLFYEICSKFAERTLIQVDARVSETKSRLTPLAIVMGGIIAASIDHNIIFTEIEKRSIISTRRERLFIPVVRTPADSRTWENYVEWACSPDNWGLQLHALNHSPEARDAGSRITLSAPLGESSFVLQCDYGAQITVVNKKTAVLCRFVPVCAAGIMSESWYFGLREAIYFLTVIKKILLENTLPKQARRSKKPIRYPEPALDMLSRM